MESLKDLRKLKEIDLCWFAERYGRFLYIDRIVIDRTFGRRGVGNALYSDLIQFAATQGWSMLCCEINVSPPNPVSHAFHAGFGFHEVGRSADAKASKVVSYQLAEVSACAATVISEK